LAGSEQSIDPRDIVVVVVDCARLGVAAAVAPSSARNASEAVILCILHSFGCAESNYPDDRRFRTLPACKLQFGRSTCRASSICGVTGRRARATATRLRPNCLAS